MYRAHGNEITRRNDGIETGSPVEQFAGSRVPAALRGYRIHLQVAMREDAGILQSAGISAVALEEFRVLAGCCSEEGHVAAAETDEVLSHSIAAPEVVRPHRQSRLSGLHRAPQNEVGSLLDQPFQPATVLQVVAVTEQNQAVCLARVLVILVPVPGLLLKRDQQVVPVAGAGARD